MDSSGTGSPSLSLKQALSCSYILWGVPLDLSSILLSWVLLTTQQLFSDIRGAREKPLPQIPWHWHISHSVHCWAAAAGCCFSCALQRLCCVTAFDANKDLSVPSLFALSSSILFHKYVIDCASAMHAVRFHLLQSKWNEPWPSGIFRMKHSLESSGRKQVYGCTAQPVIQTV